MLVSKVPTYLGMTRACQGRGRIDGGRDMRQDGQFEPTWSAMSCTKVDHNAGIGMNGHSIMTFYYT